MSDSQQTTTPSMPPSAQTLEWRICADEREWVAQNKVAMVVSVNGQRQDGLPRALQRWGTLTACLVICLMLLGGWLWQHSQRGLAEVESEVAAAIILELWQEGNVQTPEQAAEVAIPNIVDLPRDPSEIVTQVEIRDIGRDWTVVEMTIQITADGPSYRQTRLYHESAEGWVRAKPKAIRWGIERRLESKHFVFHYRTLDEAAVMQVAPQLDGYYRELTVLFGHTWPRPEKLTIRVDPEQIPSKVDQPSDPQAGVVVASPSATLAPLELTRSSLLLQSLVLALSDRFNTDMRTGLNTANNEFRLHNALRMSFIWEHDLPLARWRKPLVQWILQAPEADMPRDPFDVPGFAYQLCSHHNLWMQSPLAISVPILCWHNKAFEGKVTAWAYPQTLAELSTKSLLYPPVDNFNHMSRWMEAVLQEPGPHTILLATIFEYVALTYGSDSVALLAAFSYEQPLETVIPVLFGVSLEQFEAGWRGFLVEQYDLIQ